MPDIEQAMADAVVEGLADTISVEARRAVNIMTGKIRMENDICFGCNGPYELEWSVWPRVDVDPIDSVERPRAYRLVRVMSTCRHLGQETVVYED